MFKQQPELLTFYLTLQNTQYDDALLIIWTSWSTFMQHYLQPEPPLQKKKIPPTMATQPNDHN